MSASGNLALKAANKRIASIQFSALSTEEIERCSAAQICSQDLVDLTSRTRIPAKYGSLDTRLGVSDKTAKCATCNKGLADCAGHFGFIRLELPVFHPGFFKHTLQVLQVVCKRCSRCLLPERDREGVLSKFASPSIDAVRRTALLKKVLAVARRSHRCQFCGFINGNVRKMSGAFLKITHEYSEKRPADREKSRELLESFISACPELEGSVDKPVEEITPLQAYSILRFIPDEDANLLWMFPEITRPDALVIGAISVSPVPIRPSTSSSFAGVSGTTEDDLTMKLQEIVVVNNALKLALDNGATMKTVLDDWNFLQVQVAQYINSEATGIPRSMASTRPMRGLCQRLKGKHGRFRGNLSGKRVDFSARTVISPDPNLTIEQVGVPVHVAKTMTYPEKVTSFNMEKLRQFVLNGPHKYPGANTIRYENGFARTLLLGDRQKAAFALKVGDVVERHMIDDDVVLFNRQPSLHKPSIMAHRAKICSKRKTFQFNECSCAPYNADFDGDEMNMHLPQTEEAKAEAAVLMSISNNLISPRNGEPLVAASQDFLTGAYLLTKKNVFFARGEFCRLASYLSDATEHITLPMPAILKPRQLWTGKQLMSLLVRPSPACSRTVNLECIEKFYTGQGYECLADAFVLFRNGELLLGNVGKKTLGGESKTGLFFVLIRDFGSNHATECMSRLSKLCARYLGDRGISFGLDDVMPSKTLTLQKERIMVDGDKRASELIESYKAGELRLKTGCNADQTLESDINDLLGQIRQSCGDEAMVTLSRNNAPFNMAQCGAKGSALNISQMISCLGQQSVGGMRIKSGFTDRTLPHFEPHSLSPASRGFVVNSFYSGLTATEFFFHTMGGREGLVDTAVKTSETGYMARRLMKALEDLSVRYDSTVRNSENIVVQFIYGDDGLDPHKMESNGPVTFSRLLQNICTLSTSELCLEVSDAKAVINQSMKLDDMINLSHSAPQFYKLLQSFLAEMMSEWDKTKITSYTASQLHSFLQAVVKVYRAAAIEPGEAVGAIAAQSLSEPGTQMTLKTFHFAGVASMNVTLGVPRLQEIINASPSISTPIIEARLVGGGSKELALRVKSLVGRVTLKEVARIEETDGVNMHITVELDLKSLVERSLNIDGFAIKDIILSAAKAFKSPLKMLSSTTIEATAENIRVNIFEGGKNLSTLKALKSVKRALAQVVVSGIETVKRVVINEDVMCSSDKKVYYLLLEGYGLSQVLGVAGIDGTATKSNHIAEIYDVFGIEAARVVISSEIKYIMDQYGIRIDVRHLLLLADVMTFKGEVLGITRSGIAKMRESVLMLASFEKTTDHLFDAAVHARQDHIVGVSECIITGSRMPLGTGMFDVLS